MQSFSARYQDAQKRCTVSHEESVTRDGRFSSKSSRDPLNHRCAWECTVHKITFLTRYNVATTGTAIIREWHVRLLRATTRRWCKTAWTRHPSAERGLQWCVPGGQRGNTGARPPRAASYTKSTAPHTVQPSTKHNFGTNSRLCERPIRLWRKPRVPRHRKQTATGRPYLRCSPTAEMP